MGFFSRIGGKIAGALHSGSRLGQKALGNVARVGHKIASVGTKIVSGIERIPILGQALAPATGIARSAIGLVRNVADGAEAGRNMLREGDAIVRAGASALRTGDTQGAMDTIRRTKALGGQAKGQIERARQVKEDAVKLSRR
tara:strand:+ start:5472 stop:5897 length:426 start_codon:yes stop_codon:yes gene_type:complete